MQVFELSPQQVARAAPLFETVWFDEAQIFSVIEGKQVGRVFVDDPDRPTAALLCHVYGFYAAGDTESSALRRFIAEAPAEAGAFQTLYGYMVDAPWKHVLLDDHEGKLKRIDRHAFHYPVDAPLPEPPVPEGAVLVPMDRRLAERIDDEMGQWIESFWGGYDRFAAGGFGFAAMAGDAIASIAYAISVSSRTANIDVETVQRFQKQGYSTFTSAAFIRHCRQRGLIATWDSDGTNAASLATARRLTFEEDPPFWQLSPPEGAPKTRSHGLWERGAKSGGTASWQRRSRRP